jgi:hypothetical protein
MNKKLNWLNEADISSLAYKASRHFLGDCCANYLTEKESFIYKHHEDILKDGYYQLFETNFQSFSKYAKYFGLEPIRED